MATVLNRTTGLAVPYRKDLRRSVNTPDFPTADWIVNPDLSAVAGFDSVYWDITADTVTLVDQATRDARDAEIAAYEQGRLDQSAKDNLDTQIILRAIVRLVVDELNILRAEHALPDRTYAQARTAIFNLIDGGV